MYITDDPITDFERYDAEQQKMLKKLPKCIHCSEPIQDEHLYDIDGELFCEECMKEIFRKPTESYIEDEG